MTDEIFSILGFSSEETRTYLCLLDNGSSTGGQIAKALGIPRPTAYNYLEQLAQSGLASKSMRGNVKIFTAEPPARLKLLYEKKLSDLQNRQDPVNDLIRNLENGKKSALVKPRIRFFEGQAEIESALLDLLNHENIDMPAFWSVQSALTNISEDFYWYFHKERIKRNIFIKGIWAKYDRDYVRRYPFQISGPEMLRETRIAPAGFNTAMTCRIYANKVLAFSSSLENFCFMIESAEYAGMLTNMHKIIWNISTPVTPDPKDGKAYTDYLKKREYSSPPR